MPPIAFSPAQRTVPWSTERRSLARRQPWRVTKLRNPSKLLIALARPSGSVTDAADQIRLAPSRTARRATHCPRTPRVRDGYRPRAQPVAMIDHKSERSEVTTQVAVTSTRWFGNSATQRAMAQARCHPTHSRQPSARCLAPPRGTRPSCASREPASDRNPATASQP